MEAETYIGPCQKSKIEKQPFIVVFTKRWSESMQQISGEHSFQSVKQFIEIALQRGCFSVNLLGVFRIPFAKNTFGGLLLIIESFAIRTK